ncbi:hypothetical protein, partial [Francisella philomiragia]|uniref:hypothetical protein n=1 Tax=Francisella philomiragia TaxID=28110 RepID=UPI0035142E8D
HRKNIMKSSANFLSKNSIWRQSASSRGEPQHINFVGRYKFLSKSDDINFESLADVLIEELESFLNR